MKTVIQTELRDEVILMGVEGFHERARKTGEFRNLGHVRPQGEGRHQHHGGVVRFLRRILAEQFVNHPIAGRLVGSGLWTEDGAEYQDLIMG